MKRRAPVGRDPMERDVGEKPDDPPAWLVPRTYPTVGAARAARRDIALRVKPLLDAVLRQRDQEAAVAHDPVSFVHRFHEPLDQELIGLLASSLAFGNVKVILRSIGTVVSELQAASPSGPREAEGQVLLERLSGFSHRWIRAPAVVSLLVAGAALQREHGSLGALFTRSLRLGGGDIREALRRFAAAFRDSDHRPAHGHREPPAGSSYLLPDGTRGGACKRVHMYLRWMVRGPDGVDLGIWRGVPRSSLLMPLDTHTGRICKYLGLTTRRDVSWKTAEEVTWNLRAISPEDPIRYDFALAHLGISRDCAHGADAAACRACVLAAACDAASINR